MDEIRELIKIVTDNTKKNLPLLDIKNQHVNGNKEMNLFIGIKNGQFNDELEASNGIYGSEEVDIKFRMLKSRLNRKLLNHLFFMDFSAKSYPKSINFYQEVLDYLHFSRMLLNVEETKIGAKLLYKTLDLAKEGEYTLIVVDCLKALRELYAKTYRPKLFQNIKSQLQEVEKLQIIEEKADAVFQENRLSINSTVNNRKKSFKSYKKAIDELEGLYRKSNSYNIFEKLFKIKVWYYELKGDFESVLKLIGDVEKECTGGKINQRRFDDLFAKNSKGNALLKLKKFNEGSVFLEEMLNSIESSSKAWYAFAEKYVALNIQNKNFDKASEIFLRVIGNKSFDAIEKKEQLKWNILRSYLFYITENKKVLRKFDYSKFIQETPVYEKENAGYHVAVLILQILNMVDGDLSSLHNKLDAMDDYVNRYLNNSFSKRTKTFCRLLHKIAIHNRDYDSIVLKSKYLQEKLINSEIAGESYVDFEIVSYEYLWEKMMSDLKISKKLAK